MTEFSVGLAMVADMMALSRFEFGMRIEYLRSTPFGNRVPKTQVQAFSGPET
jgi:hypothetical protein